MDVYNLLNYCVIHNASDLHLSSGVKPLVRIDNELREVPTCEVLKSEVIYAMLLEILPPEYIQNISDKNKKIDFDCALTSFSCARLRLNIFHQHLGLSVAIRIIPIKVPTIEQLNLPKILLSLCNIRNGLIIVTGPTGSGKTTTLAAMIDYINSNKHAHVLTIEDPIEYLHTSKKSLINQREINSHVQCFGTALRSALREDPDYILVGEMRDLETIRMALRAAETGHLVFTSLHTNSAIDTIERIIDVFPEGDKGLIKMMLANTLKAVISQILIKRVSGGRVAAHEILITNYAVQNLIRENKTPQIYSVMQTGQKNGMRTMEQSLHELLQRNIIAETEYKYYLKID